MQKLFAVSYSALIALTAVVAVADEAATEVDVAKVRELVEQLASKNAAPKDNRDDPIGEWLPSTPPPGYDIKAQVVVYRAIEQLLQAGAVSFDVLIEHFDDKRYAYTVQGGPGVFSATVGDACRKIVNKSVHCYWGREFQEVRGVRRPMAVDADVVEWWKKNKDRPLWQLQLEAIDRELQFFKAIDYFEDRPTYPISGGLMPQDKFESLRKNNIETLERIRARISETQKAHVPTMNDIQWAMIGVPWRPGLVDDR